MAVKVLMIGSGKFQNPKLNASHGLKAPVNDLKIIRFLFTWRFGVAEDDIISVGESGKATRKDIRSGLRQLTKAAQVGDTIVVYYTGHGHRVTNRIQRVGEPLNLYGIVPYDVSAGTPDALRAEELFLANELNDALVNLQKLKKPRAQYLILDCCFSGGFKDAPLPVRVVEEEDTGWKVELVSKSLSAETMDELPFAADQRRDQQVYTLLAACKPFQNTQEMRVIMGSEKFAISRFTRTLFRVLCDRPDVVDLYTLQRLIGQRLGELKRQQTPVLELAPNAPFVGSDPLFVKRPLEKWVGRERRFPLVKGTTLAVGRLGGVGMGTQLRLPNNDILTVANREQVGWFETRLEHPELSMLTKQGFLVALDTPLK